MSNDYIYSQPVSLSDMQENGFDVSDNGHSQDEAYGNISMLQLANKLTGRQQQILCLIKEGKNRKEIASYLMVSEQAIHQIILRMRKRLKRYGN
jgi:DNA-binding NarL/FixJ family response regulator